MSMEISPALKEAIQQQLPGMFATEMQEFITAAKKAVSDNTTLKQLLEAEKADAKRLKEQLAQHADINQRVTDLNARAQKLQEQELALLKREAKLEADVAKAELAGVRTTQELFLRLPGFRRNVVESTHEVLPGHNPTNGGYSIGPAAVPVQNSTITNEEHY